MRRWSGIAAGFRQNPPARAYKGRNYSSSSEMMEVAQRAAEATGEAALQFVARAVGAQAKRDEPSLVLGINPATGDKLEQSGKGGADHE